MKMKRELKDFGELSAAEQKIVDELDSGEPIELHDGLPPDVPDNAYDVRAEFIRYLALGGCEACRLHEKGLRVVGARITGALDLEGCDLPRDLGLIFNRFEDEVIFRGAKLQNLLLSGSTFPKGLVADGLSAKGKLFLRRVEADQGVSLLGANIGGDLDCDGAKFNAALDGNGVQQGFSFCADGLEVQGSVLFRAIESRGWMRLIGAKLGGSLECESAKFRTRMGYAFSTDRLEAKGGVFLRAVEAHGTVSLSGSRFDGDLSCTGARFNAVKSADGTNANVALSMEGLKTRGTFFLRGGAEINGVIFLAGAQVAALNDDADCWPKWEGQIDLDRFRYEVILSVMPMSANARILWLAKSNGNDDFSPQPYEQLAKVLREMGHREDARVILIEKERLQRAATHPPWWRRVWNRVMRESAGYGYRPALSLRYLAVLLILGTYVFGAADYFGAVKPNSARVWHLSTWKNCAGKEVSQSACYLASSKGKSYPAFNPFIYSIDTLLPIVDLEMQGAWIPDDRASWWGISARFYLWAHIALGWFFSLLAVAGFSGLIKPE